MWNCKMLPHSLILFIQLIQDDDCYNNILYMFKHDSPLLL